MDDATIAAIATPNAAAGGIGIIRLSGPLAFAVAGRVFSRAAGGEIAGKPVSISSVPGTRMDSLLPYMLYHGYIIDGDSMVDEVMLVRMPAPRSYTGEDVVEIHAHGGRYVLKAILSLLMKNGARLAEAGEFTRRAFLNGRIDLSQAEAVADIIWAGSDTALVAAADQMAGRLGKMVAEARKRLIAGMAHLDAAIDFAEQTAEESDGAHLTALIENDVLPVVDHLIHRHESAWHLKNGVRVAIAGAPNVGKSTLLNVLAGAERAIVSNIPGTTRDLIEISVIENGVSFAYTDMAGIRESAQDPVEAIGMERALSALEKADVVMFLVDATAGITPSDEAVYTRLRGCRVICVANKIDLGRADGFSFPPQWAEAFSCVRISAKTGRGMDQLKAALWSVMPDMTEEASRGEDAGGPVPNLRHKDALDRTRAALGAALASIDAGVPTDVVAIDIREAVSALGEITGENVGDDVLEAIFNRFCVGK